MTKNDISALDAKFEAQKIAFAPIYFQAVVAMKKLGILPLIGKNRKGIAIAEICNRLNISDYGVRVLLEAGESMNVIEYLDRDTVKLTKVGFFVNSDELTRVNINFIEDVCYKGAQYLTDSIKNSKPEGLKTIGSWETIYQGLSLLEEPIRTSWFEFDHYYSDDAFRIALGIVFKEQPKRVFDIGGNTGKWAIACCKYDPDVKVTILDLPVQLAVAEKNVTAAGFAERVDFHKANMLDTTQLVPKGPDAVWMSQFLDCFSEQEILNILKNVNQAISDDAFVYIMEPFFDNQKYEAARYCLTGTSLYFTTMANGNSKMYSIDVMNDLVEQAGMKVVETFPLIGDSYHTILKCKKV